MDQINLLVVPCVSPWSYEYIQRWQADLKDPNRCFANLRENPAEQPQKDASSSSYCPESQALMDYLRQHQDFRGCEWTCHLDLHETTGVHLVR